MVAGGCGWLWVVETGCGWMCMVVGGCGWLRVVVNSCGWLWVVVDGCGWLWAIAYFSITQNVIDFHFSRVQKKKKEQKSIISTIPTANLNM